MIDLEAEAEYKYKKYLEGCFIMHINKRCKRYDCHFCRDFDHFIKLIDPGLLEDFLAGNY